MAMWNKGAVVIGCRENTREFIEQLIVAGHQVSGIVTLCQKAAEKAQVPSWCDLDGHFANRIPVYTAETYKLISAQDVDILAQTQADVAFCIGWQRLLPDWFLNRFRNGVFGMHTCENPLPNGRGRSPINWSLIEGAEYLHAHVFRYDSGADDGLLLDVTKFKIMPEDDIDTLQSKCRVIFNQVVDRHWETLVHGTPALFEQDKNQPVRHYPKRTPDDGEIDWHWDVKRIINWVRAQTRPYPGAFCVINEKRYLIWRCQSSDRPFSGEPPGLVIDKYDDNSYLVSAADGYVHIIDHTLPKDLEKGTHISCSLSAKTILTGTSA